MAGRPRTERTIKICEYEPCSGQFAVTAGKAQQARRFCSRECGSRATAKTRGDTYRASHGYVPPVCPCGKAIVPTPGRRREQYAYTKKYCDDECRKKYMINGHQRDPEKWATYICQKPGCGKPFERRKSHRNHKIYCSMACANTMTKKKHHIVLRDDDVVLDSSWEALFYGACKIAKVKVERFDRDLGVAWDPEHPDRWYAPDFWLPDIQPWKNRVGVAVEIKGLEDDHDDARWAALRATGIDLVVMNQYRMEHLSPHALADVVRISALYDNTES